MSNILLAVCGMNPQVITETLYALFHEGRQVDAIHVITTRAGKEKIMASLLSPLDGAYYRFLEEYGLDPAAIDFQPAHVHVLRDARGSELEDIIRPEDNEALLATCLDLASAFAREPDSAVYFLVAGGRKTMTSCLTLAAQLYGRPQDRIYHVLVSPEFESSPDFWYPPRQSRLLALRNQNGQVFHKETRYAAIHLIQIPFVSVRDRINPGLLSGPQPVAELMQSLIRDEPKGLIIDLAGAKISYNGAEMDMHPARLAIYAFFALRKKEWCRQAGPCRDCVDCFVEVSEIEGNEVISDLYARIGGSRRPLFMSDTGILRLSRENFNSYKSKIRQDLLSRYGQAHIHDLEITAIGAKPDTRYGLLLDRERIRIEPSE